MNIRFLNNVLLGAALFFASVVHAQSASPDEQQLVERVKAQVMKELRESDFLKQEIQAGIQDYIRQQREAQAAARAKNAQAASEKAKRVRRVSRERDHILGDPDAPVSIIEYSDFECPYCKRFHATPKRLVEAYDGRVNWVYRHFPLGFHNPGAQRQAEASECAAELGGNDGFWKYTDALYAKTRSGGKGFPIANLVPLARDLGLDPEGFKACLDSGRHAGRVQQDLQEGANAGISGTPGNILLSRATGKAVLMAGAVSYAQLKAAVDRLLAAEP